MLAMARLLRLEGRLGLSPLSVWATLSTYLIVTALLVYRKRSRVGAHRQQAKNERKRLVLAFHNFLMSFSNGCVLVYLARALTRGAQLVGSTSPTVFMCDATGNIFATIKRACVANLWMKMVELLDTLLVLASGSSVSKLHIYHHAATLMLADVQLREESSVQFVPILLNCATHVAMYAYYALASVIIKPTARKRYLWWKRHLTILQVTQFALAVPACLYVTVLKARFRLGIDDDGSNDCSGTFRAAAIGIGILSSYLLLFLSLLLDGVRTSRGAVSQR